MCKQKTTYEALKKSGALKGQSKAETAMTEATIEDTEMLAKGQNEIRETQRVMGARMEQVEKDIAEIKENMVTQKDLQEFKDALIPAIQKASKFDLVERLCNWKAILVTLVLILGAILIVGFGIRGLEILAPIGNTVAGRV